MYNNFHNTYFQQNQNDQQKAFAEWQESMRELFSQQDKFMREQNEIIRRQFEEYRTRLSAGFPPPMAANQFMQPPSSCNVYYPFTAQDERIRNVFRILARHTSNNEELATLAIEVIAELDPYARIEYIREDDDEDNYINIVIKRYGFSKQYIFDIGA